MLARVDLALLRVLRTRAHGPRAERAVIAFSTTGNNGALWLAASGAGAALCRSRRAAFGRAAATVVSAFAVNQLFKLVVGRRRPQLPGLPPLRHTVSSLTYPSAHATTSFAGARALAPLVPGGRALYAVAAAMAVSRPYLGVHYPSDTLAGAALGTAVAELAR